MVGASDAFAEAHGRAEEALMGLLEERGQCLRKAASSVRMTSNTIRHLNLHRANVDDGGQSMQVRILTTRPLALRQVGSP